MDKRDKPHKERYTQTKNKEMEKRYLMPIKMKKKSCGATLTFDKIDF